MIPKIIHRTIPKETTPLMDECWDSVLKHTKDWTHMTHYDEDNYKYVKKFLPLCDQGAFRADLIRLEVLYRYGGIYLDSDVKLFKPIDNLLEYKSFAVLENDSYLMNGIMGAEPGNKEIYKMLKFAILIVQSNKFKTKKFIGSMPFGPYITNYYSKNNVGLNKLPSEYFLTYFPDSNDSNSEEKTKTKIDNLLKSNIPYGQHIYAGSWINE